MNEIFNNHSQYIIVYINDVLIYSHSIEQHFKHVSKFIKIVGTNGLVVSKPKISLFQIRVRFLGHWIYQGTITPIERAIQFANKFPNQIIDKNQLQRFLGCLNYIAEFIPQLSNFIKSLYQ